MWCIEYVYVIENKCLYEERNLYVSCTKQAHKQIRLADMKEAKEREREKKTGLYAFQLVTIQPYVRYPK